MFEIIDSGKLNGKRRECLRDGNSFKSITFFNLIQKLNGMHIVTQGLVLYTGGYIRMLRRSGKVP